MGRNDLTVLLKKAEEVLKKSGDLCPMYITVYSRDKGIQLKCSSSITFPDQKVSVDRIAQVLQVEPKFFSSPVAAYTVDTHRDQNKPGIRVQALAVKFDLTSRSKRTTSTRETIKVIQRLMPWVSKLPTNLIRDFAVMDLGSDYCVSVTVKNNSDMNRILASLPAQIDRDKGSAILPSGHTLHVFVAT